MKALITILAATLCSIAALGQAKDTTTVKVDTSKTPVVTPGGAGGLKGSRADGPGGVKERDSSGKFNQTLSAVTVQGTRPFIQHKAGKIIVNVAESPIAAGGNATDIIAHIPGVDGLQYHGRALQVMIDGRPTGLRGADVKTILDGMAAGSIERVELIQSPSARYDAAGGAVLNIVTIKSKKPGANGTLTSGVGAGRYMKFNEGGTINYRTGKLNLYGGYDYLHGKPFYDYYTNRRVDSARTITETTNGTRISNSHTLRAGLDYEIDKQSSAGILFRGIYNLKRHDARNQSTLSNTLTGTDSLSAVTTTGDARYFIPSVNAWYKRSLDTLGRELSVNVDYLHYGKKWDEGFTTRRYDAKGVEYSSPDLLRDHSPAGNSILSLSADYIHPLKTGKLEMGVKTNFTHTDNDVLWENYDGMGWVNDNGKSNHFIYKENINAAYANYSRNWTKIGLQFGLRAEQTRSEGRSITLGRTDKKDYVSFFPNASLQYTPSADHQFGLSYRRGIERFGFDIVNPFVRYISQYSYSQGNPNIRPSTSQNFDLSYSWKGELNVSVSYQHFLDAPGTVFTKADTGNAVISSETNLGSADQFQTEIAWSKGLLGGKWMTNNSVGAMYAKYNTSSDLRQPGARWTAMLSSDNVFSFGKGWKLQVSAMYYSPFLLGVYSFRSRFQADMGISKTVLSNKGKLSLNISDVFNSMVNKYDVTSYGIASYNRQKAESQVVRLVFSYKFGGKGQKNQSAKKSGIEDLKQRLGGN